MKTFTAVLSVRRLLHSLFTFGILLFSVSAWASDQTEMASDVAVSSSADLSNDIEFASLAATANNKAVLINWVTASERNNSHFEVERSTDQKDFKTVALVLDGFAAAGTGKTYKFKEDAGDVRKGKTVYYRLKQVDTDNKVHYSKVMAVQMNTTVTIVPDQDLLNNSSTKPNTTQNKLLSKQSTSKKGNNDISAGGSLRLSAGISDSPVLMTENELNFPKLVFA